eukprot:TRINITY_DN3127_c0_g1_i4.p2 TRINITY_DN3127_c0_g1~~TRINITY_DN3127_c0_g1_i4.p2  ORF type:complete len:303 (-),score=67.09 TRINITY_DN3127_c0_g1_i4:1190-2098(-)
MNEERGWFEKIRTQMELNASELRRTIARQEVEFERLEKSRITWRSPELLNEFNMHGLIELVRQKPSILLPGSQPPTCMLVRTYKKKIPELLKFSLSASFSGLPLSQVKLYYIVTGVNDEEEYKATVNDLDVFSKSFNNLVGMDGFSSVLPISFGATGDRDFGYNFTDIALRDYFYGKSPKYNDKYPHYSHPNDCEFIIITNGDNYYLDGWLKFIKEAIPAVSEFIYFNMYSHHWEAYLDTKPVISSIDLGAAMFNLTFLRKSSFFFTNLSRDSWIWDGIFIEKVNLTSKHTTKVKRMLFVHE